MIATPRAAASGRPAAQSSQAIESLVRRIENLREGPLVFHEVVRLGDAAVPALERVVRGPSQAIPHPRCLAADALAAIGTPEAVGALLRAERDSIARELPPQLQEAEDVLVNHIAVHLIRWRDPEVTETLLCALQRRRYPYCAQALGLIGDPRAVALLIECLYEDGARAHAARALLRFGRAAIEPLAHVLLAPRGVQGMEPPTHMDARVAAARTLGELTAVEDADSGAAVVALRQALNDGQRAVRIEAALALARCPGAGAQEALRTLATALDEESWARAKEVMQALERIGAPAEPLVISLIQLQPQDEADRRRRMRAVELAGALDCAAAVPALQSLSRAPDPVLRLRAITALDRIATAEAECLAGFLADPEPRVRLRALQALRRRGALSPESAARWLGDPDRGVRRLAMLCVREDLGAARPVLKHAACCLGSPLHGWGPRLSLWRQACGLLAALAFRRSAAGPAGPGGSLH